MEEHFNQIGDKITGRESRYGNQARLVEIDELRFIQISLGEEWDDEVGAPTGAYKVRIDFGMRDKPSDYQADSLQPGTKAMGDRLKSIVKAYHDGGFKIAFSASDERRSRLYGKGLTSMGLKSLGESKGEEVWNAVRDFDRNVNELWNLYYERNQRDESLHSGSGGGLVPGAEGGKAVGADAGTNFQGGNGSGNGGQGSVGLPGIVPIGPKGGSGRVAPGVTDLPGQGDQLRIPERGVSALVALLAGVDNRSTFFADCGRDELGHCLPGEGGDDGQAPHAEFRKAQRLARSKAANAPEPTTAERAEAHDGIERLGANKYRRNLVGNTKDRAKRRTKLLEEFGDGQTCPCVYCGLKLTHGTLEQDKIFTTAEGGRYRTPNLVPCCSTCNKARGDRTWGEIQWPKK